MASIKIVPYVDGYFATEREITVNPSPKFPFLMNPTPDVYTRAYERFFRVLSTGYIPRIAERNSWQNLLTYSEDITQAAWTKTNATVTANASTAPDGNATMDKVIETSATGEHSIAQAATVANGLTEVSIFAAAAGRNFVKVQFTDSAAAVFSAVFDVNGGSAIAPSAGVTAKLTPLGNSQFRCAITFTPASGAGTMKAILGTDPTTFSYAGDATKGASLWGGQVLAAVSGKAAPYISTTSATRTVLAPPVDPVDPMAYLIAEDEPVLENSTTATIRRVYSRIPREQITPSSLFVTKPDIPGTFPQTFGGYIMFKPIATVASYDAYQPQTVSGDSGAPGTSATGGTYTLTFGANTTAAIAYNATAATVQSSLNALASITNYGGVTVTGDYINGFTVTFKYSGATIAIGSLTGASSLNANAVVTANNNGFSQQVSIAAEWPFPGFNLDTSSLSPSGAMNCTTFFGDSLTIPGQTVPDGANLFFQIGDSFMDVPATSGSFKLTVFGQTTAAIPYNATAAQIQSALNALTNVSARGGYTVVQVTGKYQIYNYAADVPQFLAYLPQAQITGGTFTVTLCGGTTSALAYNASLSTIESALNAITGVTNRGGVHVSGAGYVNGLMQFAVTFNATPAITGSTASITPSSISLSVSQPTAYSESLTFSSSASKTRLVTVLRHGFTTSDTLFFQDSNGNYYSGVTTGLNFPTPDTIQLLPAAGSVYSATGTITNAGKRTITGYSPTATQTRVKYVTDYYLPGVSAGITTMDDIPLPTYQGDPASLLTAIFTGSSSINYQVGELKPWQGAILQRQTTTLNAAKL